MIGRVLVFLFLMASPALGQNLTALARLAGDGAQMAERRGGVEIDIEMSQSVPWRIFTLDEPARLVVDFSELDWTGAVAGVLASQSDKVTDVRLGQFRPGWSRMVVTLAGPMAVTEAAMLTTETGAVVSIRLEDTDAASFMRKAGAPQDAIFTRDPRPAAPPSDDDTLVIVLDPGHGGIDPGAEYEGVREADLVLTFARELKDLLLRQDNIAVRMTRDDDVFVPLEERVAFAHRAGADIFISLHADALAQGQANGASVYTLAEEATDVASQKLAERHDREDLLAGVDLSETEDTVALVLMDLARTETQPRADRLADSVVEGIHAATGSTYKTPRLQAGFSVLKAPDIPSILVELGFLSSKRDREKLVDPAWRAKAAEGMRDAILSWAEEDEAIATRLRQ